jgi:prolyl oligopeptidase
MHFAFIACVVSLIGAAGAATTVHPALAPPAKAPVRNVTDTHFGVAVDDPYRYLEDLKDPDVAALIKSQAHYTRELLDRVPHRQALYEEIAKYGDSASARVTHVHLSGGNVYYEKRRAADNLPKLYVRQGLRGKERLLVDPERLQAPDGAHYAIDYYMPSPDNRYLAYGISLGGSEQSVLHVLEVATGRETGDVIDRANYASPSWLPDGRLLYSRLQKLAPGAPVTDKYQNQRVYLHRLGSDPEQDGIVFGAGVAAGIDVRPVELVFSGVAPGSDYVVAVAVNGTQREVRIWTARVAALDGGKTRWTRVCRHQRPGDGCERCREHAVHGVAQGCAALQGAALTVVRARYREGRGRRPARGVDRNRHRGRVRRALRAANERRHQRVVATRLQCDRSRASRRASL